MPATPITHAEGTATVSSAERLGGVRRRERDAAREPGRGCGTGRISSWSSSRETAGSSPVSPGSPGAGPSAAEDSGASWSYPPWS